jgi:3-hydroxybutyrate dehydrogenase
VHSGSALITQFNFFRKVFMLLGKTALVTGSTSGIGLGIATALARQGANIMLNGFGDIEDPQAQVLQAGKVHSIEVAHHGADMSRPPDI